MSFIDSAIKLQIQFFQMFRFYKSSPVVPKKAFFISSFDIKILLSLIILIVLILLISFYRTFISRYDITSPSHCQPDPCLFF